MAYSAEDELVLDPMVGSGTTLIEARLLGRNAIGYDINPEAVRTSAARIRFPISNGSRQQVSIGDVRDLNGLEDGEIDLIVTHPPYFNIVQYSEGKNPADLSSISRIPEFMGQLEVAIGELFRVLRPGRYCAVLIGDTRKAQHYIPLSHMTLRRFLESGFVLKEEIIKTQHNTTHGPRWARSAANFGFYLIMHEHLFVFRKPAPNERLSRIRYSTSAAL
jgi:DNA modification methylase